MGSKRGIWYLLATALPIPVAFGQVVHTVSHYQFILMAANCAPKVIVGLNGSFYEPQTVSAALNDVVQFVFSGMYVLNLVRLMIS